MNWWAEEILTVQSNTVSTKCWLENEKNSRVADKFVRAADKSSSTSGWLKNPTEKSHFSELSWEQTGKGRRKWSGKRWFLTQFGKSARGRERTRNEGWEGKAASDQSKELSLPTAATKREQPTSEGRGLGAERSGVCPQAHAEQSSGECYRWDPKPSIDIMTHQIITWFAVNVR